MFLTCSNIKFLTIPTPLLLFRKDLLGYCQRFSTSPTPKNIFRTIPQDAKKPLSPRKETVMNFMHILVSGTLIISSASLLGYFIYIISSGAVKQQRIAYLVKEGIIEVKQTEHTNEN